MGNLMDRLAGKDGNFMPFRMGLSVVLVAYGAACLCPAAYRTIQHRMADEQYVLKLTDTNQDGVASPSEKERMLEWIAEWNGSPKVTNPREVQRIKRYMNLLLDKI
jgi:hypothetical protein